MKTPTWILIIALCGACTGDVARPQVQQAPGLPSELPARALQRVLWYIRAEAGRGTRDSVTVLVHESTSQTAGDSTVVMALPASLRQLVEDEPGFDLTSERQRPCGDELRIAVAGAKVSGDSLYTIIMDEYDLRPAGRVLWGQRYMVRCNPNYCEVTDIHLGEEPDISLEWAEQDECDARRRETTMPQ